MSSLFTLALVAVGASLWTLIVLLTGWAIGRTQDGEDDE